MKTFRRFIPISVWGILQPEQTFGLKFGPSNVIPWVLKAFSFSGAHFLFCHPLQACNSNLLDTFGKHSIKCGYMVRRYSVILRPVNQFQLRTSENLAPHLEISSVLSNLSRDQTWCCRYGLAEKISQLMLTWYALSKRLFSPASQRNIVLQRHAPTSQWSPQLNQFVLVPVILQSFALEASGEISFCALLHPVIFVVRCRGFFEKSLAKSLHFSVVSSIIVNVSMLAWSSTENLQMVSSQLKLQFFLFSEAIAKTCCTCRSMLLHVSNNTIIFQIEGCVPPMTTWFAMSYFWFFMSQIQKISRYSVHPSPHLPQHGHWKR